MTLKLWNYLENSEKYLQSLLPSIKYSPETDLKLLIMSRAFGRRLERLYVTGKSKFHPVLLKRLERSDYCGIYIYSRKSKEQILKRLYTIGWSKRAKIHFIREFPKQNYFDQICTFDVVVFTSGVIPTELDIYYLYDEEKQYGKKHGMIQSEHNVYLLDKVIETYIGTINPFKKINIKTEVIGIGGQLKGFPDWYKTLEGERDKSLFDANDQPILSMISRFYVPIGCYIPHCTDFFDQNAKYWHAHNDPLHPKLSLQNFQQAKTHSLIDFGFGYNVSCKLANGKERRLVVPIELYDLVFNKVDINNNDVGYSLPEECLFIYSSPNGRKYRLLDSDIVSTSILARVNLRSLEYRRNFVSVFQKAIFNQEKPHLVLISPKGTFKSTFIKLMRECNANIGFIDSDDFGSAISEAYFRKNQPQFIIDPADNFIINWFRSQFPDLEVPITEFSPSDFSQIANLHVQIDAFAKFWKDVFDKGYDDVPSFYNYVNTRIVKNMQFAMNITMTHNLFEARLCQSKMILTIEAGIDLQDVIIRRAIVKDKTVAQFLADELYQRYCLSSTDLHFDTIGWGDLFVALLEMGVTTIAQEQV